MTTEQEFFNKLAEVLEKQFPKNECKERSAALVLNAMANVYLEDALKQEREKMATEIDKIIELYDNAEFTMNKEIASHIKAKLKK